MDISASTVLKKMEEQLQKARSTQDMGRLREHVTAIRVLCDVILEKEHQTSQGAVILPSFEALVPEVKTERAEIGDDANGPSLFDF